MIRMEIKMRTEIPNKNSLAKGIATYFIEKLPIHPNKNSFRKTLNRKYFNPAFNLGLVLKF